MRRAVKRGIDLIAATLGLLILSPAIALCAIAIYARMGRPIFFRQTRPGLHEQPFRLVKFRTMRESDQARASMLPDRMRLTPLGRFLRRTSLDEVPTLWNVVRGDMSLVGPRPLLRRYLPFFTDRERARFTVRPGITGLAQISGRNLMSWGDRLAADISYVETWSLSLDVRIIFSTVVQVISGHGVVADANEVMRDLDEERFSEQEGPA
jgi:lipopolysaccharide/colanic/teichoic acid biosynthesis glycosyltransferase